ncbi:hypothetical protein [Alteribacter keqinensis]|uniref:Replicative helicase inhibitor G39P N-terminal domain-containing protein n=1 Tax=Alteribacter keqinensis TaxID=2483800 RepID=A0A3M7TPJ4_9BACI|nr:hypothetical protein [Alteribacter keqinensis]RNA66937.1 hypothetical protein EBO34_17205 [Alteribacter keqinensis]
MDKQQAAKVIKDIDRFYPGRMRMDIGTVESWFRHLEKEEYDTVIGRLDAYAKENKYPPTLFDLLDNPRPERDRKGTDKVKEWEAKASGGPVEHSSGVDALWLYPFR